MSNRTHQNAQNIGYEQAQEWFIKLQAEPDNPKLLNQFQQWLDQAEENESLYLETCLLWQDMEAATEQVVSTAQHGIKTQQDLNSLEAREKQSYSSIEITQQPSRPLSKWKVFSAVSLASVLALIVVLLPPHVWYSSDYFTPVGEQLSIRLEDGSMLHLNSQSAVNIHYSESFRDIELLYGEAFFEVAKNKTRPFRVTSQGVMATAVGTAFNIRQLEHEVQTTLTEGKLRVSLLKTNQQSSSNITLEAGQEVTYNDMGAISLSDGNRLYLPDWKRHLLRLDDVPLSDVIALLNRQYSAHLILLNVDRKAEKMTGVIPLGDLELTLKMLRNSLHLDTTDLFHHVVLLR